MYVCVGAMFILSVTVALHVNVNPNCRYLLICLMSLPHRAPIVLIQSALAGAVEARVPVPIPALVSLGGMDLCVNISVWFKVMM